MALHCYSKEGNISGKEYVYPVWPYCYKSVVQTLEALVKRPGFEEKCEEWRTWKIPKDVLGHVHDGHVWQDTSM